MCETDLPLAASHGDVDESASVSESLLGAAFGSLLLLLGLDLYARNHQHRFRRSSQPDTLDAVSAGASFVFLRMPLPILAISHVYQNMRTLGVCDLTFPARARDPWTLPMIAECGCGGFDGKQ